MSDENWLKIQVSHHGQLLAESELSGVRLLTSHRSTEHTRCAATRNLPSVYKVYDMNFTTHAFLTANAEAASCRYAKCSPNIRVGAHNVAQSKATPSTLYSCSLVIIKFNSDFCTQIFIEIYLPSFLGILLSLKCFFAARLIAETPIIHIRSDLIIPFLRNQAPRLFGE